MDVAKKELEHIRTRGDPNPAPFPLNRQRKTRQTDVAAAVRAILQTADARACRWPLACLG